MRIQRRLLLAFGLLLGGVLVFATATLGRWVSRAAEAQLADALSREATILAAELERAPPVDANAWAHDHEVRTGTRMTLIAPSGKVLADSGPLGVEAGRTEDLGRAELVAARSGRLGSEIRSAADRSLLYVAVPVGRVAPFAMLRVARTLDPVGELVARAEAAVLLACVLALGLAVLLAVLLSRWLARTLNAMTRATRAMAQGEFELPLPSPPDDELGDLVRALALLRGQLASRIAELRSEGQKLKTILDGMAEGVVLVQRGRITVANAPFARLLGASAEVQVEGRSPLEAARVPELGEVITAALSAGAPAQREVLVNGRPLMVQALPLGERGSEQAVVVISDLSEPRRLERLRRDLVANASHELRTPVAAIVGVAETLADGAADDPEARASFIDILLRHALRLAALTRDLLDLSRLEAGYKPRVETVAVAPAVEAVMATLTERVDEKQLAIEVSLAPDLTIAADRRALEQILSNLIENAIKYTPAGGRVSIRGAVVNAETALLTVEDTGPGIPPEHQARIFERFYRVDDARSRELGGTGLGLAIVKHLVLANGGEVSVESRVGDGSRFLVRLPRAAIPRLLEASL